MSTSTEVNNLVRLQSLVHKTLVYCADGAGNVLSSAPNVKTNLAYLQQGAQSLVTATSSTLSATSTTIAENTPTLNDAVSDTLNTTTEALASGYSAAAPAIGEGAAAIGDIVERSTTATFQAYEHSSEAISSGMSAAGPALDRAITAAGLEGGRDAFAPSSIDRATREAWASTARRASAINVLTPASEALAGAYNSLGAAWPSSALPPLPPLAPVGERCRLLASRTTVTDLARLAEQVDMDDLTPAY